MQVSTQARWRTGAATAAGTCGELAQGVLPSGQRFHVTCPIDRTARVSVRVRPATETSIVGLPADMWKTRLALLRAAQLLELAPSRIEVDHASDLRRAKGLASSTADVVAAVRALAHAHDVTLGDETLGALAAAIEPSDGVMYEGIVAVDQLAGSVVRRWSWWPQFTIAMFTPPARRETGRLGAPVSPRYARDYVDLLAKLDVAADRRDAASFAEQATRSARLSETAAPNPLASALLCHLGSVGAAGLCVGHSGTVCGLLFHGDDAATGAAEAIGELASVLPAGCATEVVRTPPWDQAAERASLHP